MSKPPDAVASLREPLDVICGRRGPPAADRVLSATDALDGWARDRSLPRALRHYLQRRNYGRALAWVEMVERGEDPGSVLGHHP